MLGLTMNAPLDNDFRRRIEHGPTIEGHPRTRMKPRSQLMILFTRNFRFSLWNTKRRAGRALKPLRA